MAVGDVQLQGESGATYTLNFGVNAMCRLEELDPQQRTYQDVLREMQTGRPSMRTIRAVVAAGLVEPTNQTVEQVGAIIEDFGGVLVVTRAFATSHQDIVDGLTAPIAAAPKRKRK